MYEILECPLKNSELLEKCPDRSGGSKRSQVVNPMNESNCPYHELCFWIQDSVIISVSIDDFIDALDGLRKKGGKPFLILRFYDGYYGLVRFGLQKISLVCSR